MDLSQVMIRYGHGTSEFPMYKGSFTYIHETTYGPWEKSSFVPVTTRNGVQKLFLQNRSLVLNKEEGFYYLPQEMAPFSKQDPEETKDLPIVNRLEICIPAEENEHFYGLGETFACLDLKGQLMRVWVAEHQNEKRIEAKYFIFYITVESFRI